MSIWALLPFTVFGLVFAAYPIVQVIRMSFSHVSVRSGGFVWDNAGVDNFQQVFSNSLTWKVFGNTAIFVVSTVVLSIICGVVLAFLVDRVLKVLPIARNVLIWPAVVAPVIVSLMWLLILSPTEGRLNKVLKSLGLRAQGWIASETSAMISVIIVDVWHWTPVVFLFVYTALKAIDNSVIEAARIDGAK